MDIYKNNIYNLLNLFLINDITELIFEYIFDFNNVKLISEYNFEKSNFLKNNFQIIKHDNKIYLYFYGLNTLHIYDEIEKYTNKFEIFNDNIATICNIDDDIYIATTKSIYLYNYKKKMIKHICNIDFEIEEIFGYKNYLLYSNFGSQIILKNLLNEETNLINFKYKYFQDCLYLFNNSLYIYKSSKKEINVINIFDNLIEKKYEIEIDDFMKFRPRMYVNGLYIYIKLQNAIYVYNKRGKNIGKIAIDGVVNCGFTIDFDKIYLSKNNTLLIYQQYVE